MLELSTYEGIPHLLCPVITEAKKAASVLGWVVKEMESRYRLMTKEGLEILTDIIQNTNFQCIHSCCSWWNVWSNVVAGKEIENYIQKLSQMARAAGIHIIMATQRPGVDVITGTIKANFLQEYLSSNIKNRQQNNSWWARCRAVIRKRRYALYVFC